VRSVGAYRTRLASDLGRDVTVEMWRSYGGGEWAKRCELALATTMAEPLGGKAKLRCSVAKEKEESKKWNGGAGRLTACAAASSGEHQQRVQASHGAWPGRSVGRRRAAYTRPLSSESPEHCSA